MNMSNHTNKVIQGKRANWVRWSVALFVMGLIAVSSIIGVSMVRDADKDALFISSPAPMTKIISTTSVTVPANVIVGRIQRSASVLPKLRMALLWPNFTGFRDADAVTFLNTNSKKLVFVTLAKRSLQGDTNDTLERVYLPLFEGTPSDGPAGLRMQNLKAGIGYDGEFIALHASENEVWAARCQTQAQPNPICLRDISINNDLIMRVEFSTHLLPQWRNLERRLKQSAASWLAG